MKKFNILPESLYNMDEKGIQLGIGARVTAMIDHHQQTVYSLRMETESLSQYLRPSVLMDLLSTLP